MSCATSEFGAASEGANENTSLIRRLRKFLPAANSHRLRTPAVIVHHSIHHLPEKTWRLHGSYGLLGNLGLHFETSKLFRRLTILCAIILAFLPTIEIPTSVPSPCWLSFALELFCYCILSLRVCLEIASQSISITQQPFFTLLALSLAMCWIDVFICLAIVVRNSGNFLSWNNCGFPEPDRRSRGQGWVYLVYRFSRFLRPVMLLYVCLVDCPFILHIACGRVLHLH
jgi:hypothetical protein